MYMYDDEIVITGLGIIGACGKNTEEFFDNLLAGNANVEKIDKTNLHNIQYAGKIVDFNIDKSIDRRLNRKCARFSQISLNVVSEAVRMAELYNRDDREVGIFVGNSTAGWDSAENGLKSIFLKEKEVSPYLASNWFPAAVQGHISLAFGYKGVSKTVVGDRASGILAVKMAMHYLKTGKINCAIVVGVETPINNWGLKFYDATGQFSHDNTYSIFEKKCKGMLIGEGAGCLILERKEYAEKRISKEKILAKVHECKDCFCKEELIKDRVSLYQTLINNVENNADAVFVSGGNEQEQRIEVEVYQKLFGNQMLYTCPKTYFGNTIGAAAIMDTILAVMSMNKEVIPRSFVQKDIENMGIEILDKNIQTRLDRCLVTSMGYGGVMAALQVERCVL